MIIDIKKGEEKNTFTPIAYDNLIAHVKDQATNTIASRSKEDEGKIAIGGFALDGIIVSIEGQDKTMSIWIEWDARPMDLNGKGSLVDAGINRCILFDDEGGKLPDIISERVALLKKILKIE